VVVASPGEAAVLIIDLRTHPSRPRGRIKYRARIRIDGEATSTEWSPRRYELSHGIHEVRIVAGDWWHTYQRRSDTIRVRTVAARAVRIEWVGVSLQLVEGSTARLDR
jgi:hypothetical protein